MPSSRLVRCSSHLHIVAHMPSPGHLHQHPNPVRSVPVHYYCCLRLTWLRHLPARTTGASIFIRRGVGGGQDMEKKNKNIDAIKKWFWLIENVSRTWWRLYSESRVTHNIGISGTLYPVIYSGCANGIIRYGELQSNVNIYMKMESCCSVSVRTHTAWGRFIWWPRAVRISCDDRSTRRQRCRMNSHRSMSNL